MGKQKVNCSNESGPLLHADERESFSALAEDGIPVDGAHFNSACLQHCK